MKLEKSEFIRVIITFLVFLVFLFGAVGLFEINIGRDPLFSISSKIFSSSNDFQTQYLRLLASFNFITLFVLGTILAISIPLHPPLRALSITAATLITGLLIKWLVPASNSIPVEFFILTIFVIYIVNILISYFIEINSKQRLLNTFCQYVPPQIVSELSKQPDQISLKGEAKILTVFFCDLQNFTGVSEQINPKQLNQLLNEYFDVMTEILFKYNGTIDKYIGDAIMAFWNAPTEQSNHAQLAVEAALEMNHAIKVLATQFRSRGWPGPNMGIGINTGRANVGNMGSKYRMTYTAVGDAVNLTSRIETLTRSYRIPIIISEHTYKELKGIVCREIDRVQVRGKQLPTTIYQPLCHEKDMDNTMREKLVLHEQAIELYHDRKYRNAIRLFKELYEKDTSDKFYKAMVKNIIEKAE